MNNDLLSAINNLMAPIRQSLKMYQELYERRNTPEWESPYLTWTGSRRRPRLQGRLLPPDLRPPPTAS